MRGGSLVASPGTSIVDDGQGRNTAVHEDLQGSVDGGSFQHDSDITEGAYTELLHCFLQEAWLRDGGALHDSRAGLGWHLHAPQCPCFCPYTPAMCVHMQPQHSQRCGET